MRNEDINAFLDKELPGVIKYFYNRLGNRARKVGRLPLARELAQLTLLETWKNSLRESQDHRTLPELLDLKRQNIFSEFFSKRKNSVGLLELDQAITLWSPDPDPLQRLELKEEVQSTRIAIGEAAWTLFTQIDQGIPRKELAAERNMNTNALNTHISRLRETIRTILNHR